MQKWHGDAIGHLLDKLMWSGKDSKDVTNSCKGQEVMVSNWRETPYKRKTYSCFTNSSLCSFLDQEVKLISAFPSWNWANTTLWSNAEKHNGWTYKCQIIVEIIASTSPINNTVCPCHKCAWKLCIFTAGCFFCLFKVCKIFEIKQLLHFYLHG